MSIEITARKIIGGFCCLTANSADNSDGMDLVNAIVSAQQSQLTSQVQFAAARKMLDADKQNGAAALQLLDAATQTGEKSVDDLAVAASGVGGNVDTYA